MKFIEFHAEHALTLASWFRSKETTLLWGGRVFGWPLAIDAILERSNQPDLNFFVMEDSNKMLGFIEIKQISATEARLCRVAIAPEAQGLGYGKQLVRLALERIRFSRNIETVSLAVFQSNVKAFQCYRGLGFCIVDRDPKFKLFDGAKWPLYQMEVSLI
ncbi:GNAT family N-acetyltransferase [Reinekea marina]|uniref:GNAT family N-acetyltransferase n=1 Tax=Reinekea marina TaxID=1310421 RepID=A0ABV7WMV2_9GAMM|nr:GNAT family N-acetyltransferase [Reinekea marina]MDN3648699.1 GNAT family N-acetyltransferase [Reinekea marina]